MLQELVELVAEALLDNAGDRRAEGESNRCLRDVCVISRTTADVSLKGSQDSGYPTILLYVFRAYEYAAM